MNKNKIKEYSIHGLYQPVTDDSEKTQTMNKSKSGSNSKNDMKTAQVKYSGDSATALDVMENVQPENVLRETLRIKDYQVNLPAEDETKRKRGNERANFRIHLVEEPESRTTQAAEAPVRKQKKSKAGAASESTSDGDFILNTYLNDIGKISLLTQEEEIELAARYKAGDESAKDQMALANLRLVVKIARDYENLGLPLLDLISEGNIGLMKAVERFDPAKGGKLSTYGSWWIKQSIKRALANQSKTIRLPVHMVDKISKMRRAMNRLKEQLGREATDEEIASEINVPLRKVTHWKNISVRPASLDAPIGDEESNSFSELVEDENAATPYEQLEEKTVAKMVHSLMSGLTERENFILTYRYGLDGDGEKTLEEVGRKFGVTRERVRQIQNSALKKMRRDLNKLENLEAA